MTTRRDLLRLVRFLPFAGSLTGPLVSSDAKAAPVRPATRTVTLLSDARVAGLAYYDAALVVPLLSPGDALKLRREPENPFDARAIEIWVPGKEPRKLGYVARIENEGLAALMDEGVSVTASVVATGEQPIGYSPATRGTWREVRYEATGELLTATAATTEREPA